MACTCSNWKSCHNLYWLVVIFKYALLMRNNSGQIFLTTCLCLVLCPCYRLCDKRRSLFRAIQVFGDTTASCSNICSGLNLPTLFRLLDFLEPSFPSSNPLGSKISSLWLSEQLPHLTCHSVTLSHSHTNSEPIAI